MQALYAGLMAWTIELAVAFTMLYVLKKEESKVLGHLLLITFEQCELSKDTARIFNMQTSRSSNNYSSWACHASLRRAVG